MKLYVCYGTFPTPRPGGHPCANANKALQEAGHRFDIERTYGFGGLPDALNTAARKRIKRATGSAWVPVLQLDDGTMISGSKEIVAWAKANPAAG